MNSAQPDPVLAAMNLTFAEYDNLYNRIEKIYSKYPMTFADIVTLCENTMRNYVVRTDAVKSAKVATLVEMSKDAVLPVERLFFSLCTIVTFLIDNNVRSDYAEREIIMDRRMPNDADDANVANVANVVIDERTDTQLVQIIAETITQMSRCINTHMSHDTITEFATIVIATMSTNMRLKLYEDMHTDTTPHEYNRITEHCTPAFQGNTLLTTFYEQSAHFSRHMLKIYVIIMYQFPRKCRIININL